MISNALSVNVPTLHLMDYQFVHCILSRLFSKRFDGKFRDKIRGDDLHRLASNILETKFDN